MVLSGAALAARLKESDGKVDSGLFTISELNFLSLCTCTALTVMPTELNKLTALTALMLSDNGIVEMPNVTGLDKLKVVVCLCRTIPVIYDCFLFASGAELVRKQDRLRSRRLRAGLAS
jgi:hypothetical protein